MYTREVLVYPTLNHVIKNKKHISSARTLACLETAYIFSLLTVVAFLVNDAISSDKSDLGINKH